jgi:hypothetical protein
MRRRILLTGGSGVDSTTTDGGLAAGRAEGFAAGGAEPAGGAATAELCSLALLSTPGTSAIVIDITIATSHTSTPQVRQLVIEPRDTGIYVSVKTYPACSLEVRSQLKNNKMPRQNALYTTFAAKLARAFLKVVH